MTKEEKNKIGSTQFYDLITGQELSWQAIIYDLIKTEQLDPWDIDIGVLADKYAEVIRSIEEANFFISSKVLHACALLLRLKSEILSNRFIQELDESMYGKQEEKRYILERIEIDEDELPILVPKTPMARYKKVTLKELMGALSKAIETENRRIRKDIKSRQAEKLTASVLPKLNRIPIKDRISMIFQKIKLHFEKPEAKHITFSELAPTKEDKINSFLPILQLSNQEKLYLRQPSHFNEIYMKLEKIQEEIEELKKELGEATQELEEKIEESDDFENAELLESELEELESEKKVLEKIENSLEKDEN